MRKSFFPGVSRYVLFFLVLESRNTVEISLGKFEARGSEFEGTRNQATLRKKFSNGANLDNYSNNHFSNFFFT